MLSMLAVLNVFTADPPPLTVLVHVNNGAIYEVCVCVCVRCPSVVDNDDGLFGCERFN